MLLLPLDKVCWRLSRELLEAGRLPLRTLTVSFSYRQRDTIRCRQEDTMEIVSLRIGDGFTTDKPILIPRDI